MILSPARLSTLSKNEELITNLDLRERLSPEGAGYDLRVNSIEEVCGSGSLLIETRHTSTINKIGMFEADGPQILTLKGQSLYLVSTVEEFKLHDNMAAVFYPRSTLFRSGVIFQSGVAPYGYEGPMTFLLYIANPAGFEVQLGARFAHVLIHRVIGKSTRYKGQWQGGRVTTNKREKQI